MTEAEKRAVAQDTIMELFQWAKRDAYDSRTHPEVADRALKAMQWLYPFVDWPPDPDKQL